MILVNTALGGTVWSIADSKNPEAPLKGNIGINQVLNLTVQGIPPYTINFNSGSGSRTATLTGVVSPDACAVYWLNTDPAQGGISQRATITYPWSESR